MAPLRRTPQSGRAWDARLRRHLRTGCDEGSGSIISYIVATSVFLLSSAFLLGYALDPPEGAIANMHHQDLKSKGSQALSVFLGTPGYPQDWGDSETSIEAVERIGILERGSSIRVDASKFEALAKGRYSTSSDTNGFVDYAEAKESLGLEGYDFHLSAAPVASSATDPTYGVGTGMSTRRVAYVGDFTGLLASDAAKSEAYALETLPVSFTNLTRTTAVGTGDVYPDDASTLRTALLPNIGTNVAQTVISQGSGPVKHDFGVVAKPVYQSFMTSTASLSKALALTDGSGSLGYAKNRELRAILGEADLTGTTAPTLKWNEWVDTDRGNLSYDAGDYGFVEVSTDGGATWIAITGSDAIVYGALATLSQDTGGSPHPANMMPRTVALGNRCPACVGSASVLVAFHWVADNDNNIGYGWVVDDIYIEAVTGRSLQKTFETPEYDILVIGSNVAHNAFTTNEVKSAIRDFVDVYGGRLVVLGGEQNTNWLDPLFRAGVRGGASDIETPDSTHPILTVPNPLDWEGYSTGARKWQFTSDESDLFNILLDSGEDAATLAVSAPGAFGGTSADGSVILTTFRPYEMSGTSIFTFLANTLTYGRYRHVYLEIGPEIPTDIPLATATRTATMDRTTNSSGDYVELAFTIYIWPGGGEIPSTPPTPPIAGPPLNLGASASDATVTLTWGLPQSSSTLGLTGYVVRRGTFPDAITETVLDSSDPALVAWSNSGLTNGVTYYYTVTAKNAAGEGATSAAASATPRTEPGAPTNVALLSLVDEVRITWTAPLSDGGTLVTGYRIRWNLQGDATIYDVELGSTTTYLHSGISASIRCYRVQALNAAGYGDPSDEVCGAPAVGASAPSSFSAVSGSGAGQIALAWGVPASLGSGNLTGYQLDVGLDGVDYAPLATLALGNVSFTHNDLGSSATRHYRLQARTSVGDGAFAYASATTYTPPGPPTALTASQGLAAGTNTLAWAAPTQLNGTSLTGYKVWAGQTSGSLSLLATLANPANVSFDHAGLGGSQTWHYQVQATTTGDDGALHHEVSATTLPPPGAVATFNATRSLAAAGAINLTWTQPLVTNNATLTGYKIYSGASSASLTLLATLTSAANATFVHHGLATNQTVYYKVAATSSVGDGTNSSAEGATTQRVPNPPSSLTGTVPVLGSTTLVWTAPTETGGAGPLTYRLYRGASAGAMTDLLYEGSDFSYVHNEHSMSKPHYTVFAVNTLGASGGTGYEYS